ncbi:DegT/DnrJ/EryC1/StrS family aminotransferase [Thermodesulfobacteriota bacterium]
MHVFICIKYREQKICVKANEGENIALLRFPIIFKKRDVRDRILKSIEKKGLGATGNFPVPLNELERACDYLNKNETYPNAKEISERILTLPLHKYLNLVDIDNISQVIADCL